MPNDKEIMDYLLNNSRMDRNYLLSELEKKSPELRRHIYETQLYFNKEEQEVLEEGVTTYRISYRKEDTKDILDFIKKNNIYTYFDGDFRARVQPGNNCIVGIPEKFIVMLNLNFGDKILKVDLKREAIGRKHLRQCKKGDKVKVLLDSVFGQAYIQGTVYEADEDGIIIRRYRCRRQGNQIRVGECAKIEKITNFDKKLK